MTMNSGPLFRYASATWTPPFAHALPSSVATYVGEVSVLQVAWRRFKRELNFLSHGQSGLRRERIDVSVHRKILWIHQGTPQVGDSLMDLAARTLLRGQVDRLDLLIDEHLVPLYQGDPVFHRVASDPDELPRDYDLVLLHSASSHSVRSKFKHFHGVPFAHVYGVYTGPELNRTLFGFFRLAHLLGLSETTAELEAKACPSMCATPRDVQQVDGLELPPGAVVVCVGGVHDWRTYLQWPELIAALRHEGVNRPIVLLGSSNGLDMRDTIVSAQDCGVVIDRVAQHSLGEVYEIMRRSALVVCADGGLLHVAHAARVPVVALFAGICDPHFRVTAANQTRWLYGPNQVNDVPYGSVAPLVIQSLPASGA